MAHEIGAPAFLSIRLLGDLTGHDDNGPLAKCYTITCFDIFLQHRPNDAECIGASEFVWGEWMARGSDNVRNGRGEPGSVEARGKIWIQSQGRSESETGQKHFGRT